MAIRGVKHRDVTMRDVADLAGVATSTVSRVLSHPDRISSRTRETVLRAMRELGYPSTGPGRPRGPSGSVAVLVPDITNPFYFDVIRGTQDRLKAAGIAQVLVDTEESAEVEAASLDLHSATSIGAILAAPRLGGDELRVAAQSHPLVAINRVIPGVFNVIMDSAAAFEQALEHLASLGHRRVCYVAGPGVSWSDQVRHDACQRAGRRLGIEVVRVGPYAPKTTSGAAAADALLNTGASAAIAFNDLIAIGMLQRLAARGINVPESISLVGCDDIFGADFCNPPLTTLTAPVFQAGRQATELLLNQLNGSQPTGSWSTTLPVHLTIRGSTGPAR